MVSCFEIFIEQGVTWLETARFSIFFPGNLNINSFLSPEHSADRKLSSAPPNTHTHTLSHTPEREAAPEATDCAQKGTSLKYRAALLLLWHDIHVDVTLEWQGWQRARVRFSQRAPWWRDTNVSRHIYKYMLGIWKLNWGVSEMTNSSVCSPLCGWELYQPSVVHPFSVKDIWLLETWGGGLFPCLCWMKEHRDVVMKPTAKNSDQF